MDVYLEEESLDYDDYYDLDVLSYYKTDKNIFPRIAIMERDILNIPITIVASEFAYWWTRSYQIQ